MMRVPIVRAGKCGYCKVGDAKAHGIKGSRAMPLAILPETPPLRVDESGAIRVGKTRVLFVLVVHAFQEGATPEDIVRMYETLDLADVYAVVAFYLRHRLEVEEYLAEYEAEANAVWEKIRLRQGDQSDIRNRLLARKAALDSAGEAERSRAKSG
jgi:uncharacterized protein (DUF433 family)